MKKGIGLGRGEVNYHSRKKGYFHPLGGVLVSKRDGCQRKTQKGKDPQGGKKHGRRGGWRQYWREKRVNTYQRT